MSRHNIFIFGGLLVNLAAFLNGEFQEELKKCLSQIIQEHFTTNSILVYDSRDRKSYRERTLIADAPDLGINTLLQILHFGDRAISVSDKYHKAETILKYKQKKAASSVFIVEDIVAQDFNEISKIFRNIKNTEYWDRQGNTLIMALKSNQSTERDALGRQMAGANWRWNKAVNALAMVLEKEAFYFYTWFPYRQPDCTIPSLSPPIEVWRDGRFQNNASLFPTKIKTDLEGCHLSVVTDECYPYTFKDEDDNNQWKGFEWTLFQEIRKHFNFTVVKKELSDPDSFYDTTVNGKPSGAIGLLHQQDADIAYACLMINLERYNLVEGLPTYFHDSLTWFVPTPDPKSHAANVFEAFPEPYWIIIFVTTVAAIACFLLIIKMEDYVLRSRAPQNLTWAALRVFAIALSTPFTVASKNLLLRAFTFAFAMYSLHITTIYQASLYNLYRSNTLVNVYTSLEDCVDNNLFVWLRKGTGGLYDDEDLFKRLAKAGRSGYMDDFLIAANETAYSKTSVFLFVKSTMLSFIHMLYLDERRQPRITYIHKQFSSYPVTMFLSPGHPLLNAMTITVSNILGAGLMDFWTKKVVRDEHEGASALVSDVSLQIEHISGAIIFYGALMSLSAGVFFVEIVYWLTHGKKVRKSLGREEKKRRRQLIFRAVVDMSRDRINTRLVRVFTKFPPEDS